jgi:hypothetical protein
MCLRVSDPVHLSLCSWGRLRSGTWWGVLYLLVCLFLCLFLSASLFYCECLSICLCVCLPALYLFMRISSYSFICLPICFEAVCLPFSCLCLHLPACLSVFVCLLLCLPGDRLSIYLSDCQPDNDYLLSGPWWGMIYLSICLFLAACLWESLCRGDWWRMIYIYDCLSTPVYLSACLSVYLSSSLSVTVPV